MSQGGHIVKPSGRRKTWAIIYRDPAGIQQWEGKFKKRTEAQARLNEVLGAIDKGTYARPSSVTFERFAEDWLAGRRQIRGSTESGYGSIINKQLVPRLGAIAVSALRFEHVDAAVSGMIEDELSSKTIHNTVTLLRTMLAGKKGPSAVRRGFAFHDPTMGLRASATGIPPDHAADTGTGLGTDRRGEGVGRPRLRAGLYGSVYRRATKRGSRASVQ